MWVLAPTYRYSHSSQHIAKIHNTKSFYWWIYHHKTIILTIITTKYKKMAYMKFVLKWNYIDK